MLTYDFTYYVSDLMNGKVFQSKIIKAKDLKTAISKFAKLVRLEPGYLGLNTVTVFNETGNMIDYISYV